MIQDALKSKGWYKPPFRSFYTHADSPDSRIEIAGRNWKHTVWAGAEGWAASAEKYRLPNNRIIFGNGSTIKSLRKHLGYFHRMLDNASGS